MKPGITIASLVTVVAALPGLALLWVLRREVDGLDAPAPGTAVADD